MSPQIRFIVAGLRTVSFPEEVLQLRASLAEARERIKQLEEELWQARQENPPTPEVKHLLAALVHSNHGDMS